MPALVKPKHILISGGAWHLETLGGAYKAATEFAQYLAAQGHMVSYIAWTRSETIQENPYVDHGVEIWNYPVPKGKSPSLGNAMSHLLHSYRLTSEIAFRLPVQYLCGHDPLQFLGAAFALRNKGVSTSFSVHSPLVMEYQAQWGLVGEERNSRSASLRQAFALSVLRRIESATYRSAQIIQTDSMYTRNVLNAEYPSVVKNKGVALPLWVDLERFAFCRDKSLVRKRLGQKWQGVSPVFFTVRRLVPRMGIDNLIRAVHLLIMDGCDCRLIIGGSGPEEDALKGLVLQLGIDDHVYMTGMISEDELPLCYQAADCFVLPTKALECFGLIILEAYACGTPVIGTPIGSIPEIIGAEREEFIATGVTPEALAEKMKAFLRRDISCVPEELRSYAEQFSVERQAEKLCQLFIEVTPVDGQIVGKNKVESLQG